jgi:AcrR family transcriptional regulator
MKPIVNKENRRYRSRLREEQAEATRDRIMEAVMRIFANGVAGLSIPAVAREAGVSIPTVYRNFRTKRDLLEAIYPWSVRRAGGLEIPRTTSVDDFADSVRVVFERFDTFSDIERAAIASPGAEAVRALSIDRRLAYARQAAEAMAPAITTEGREHLARLLLVLTTTASARMLREHLGLTVDEAVQEVEWAVRAAIAGADSSREGAE